MVIKLRLAGIGQRSLQSLSPEQLIDQVVGGTGEFAFLSIVARWCAAGPWIIVRPLAEMLSCWYLIMEIPLAMIYMVQFIAAYSFGSWPNTCLTVSGMHWNHSLDLC